MDRICINKFKFLKDRICISFYISNLDVVLSARLNCDCWSGSRLSLGRDLSWARQLGLDWGERQSRAVTHTTPLPCNRQHVHRLQKLGRRHLWASPFCLPLSALPPKDQRSSFMQYISPHPRISLVSSVQNLKCHLNLRSSKAPVFIISVI